MLILAILLSAVLSYLLGSFNSSILVVRLLKHKDIRQPQCRADQYAALFWKRLCGADPGGRPGKGHHRRAALPWHL
jgi:hypothetical protein